mmetsp:Transcript_17070/g.24792  ORF Transcript_17070/g.24792 Transcript_17070/m.24792 type:complete len:328 (+) Transcript_17070:1235-2218(+)
MCPYWSGSSHHHRSQSPVWAVPVPARTQCSKQAPWCQACKNCWVGRRWHAAPDWECRCCRPPADPAGSALSLSEFQNGSLIAIASPEIGIRQDRHRFVAHKGILQDHIQLFHIRLFVKVVGRDIHLRQQGLGVDRHLNLTGHRFTQLTAVRDQHGQRHAVVLRQCGQRVDRHPNGGVLHDDGRTLAAHPGPGTEPHALVFLVRGDMEYFIAAIDLFDHTGQLLAGDGGDKGDIVGNKIIYDPLVDAHFRHAFQLMCSIARGLHYRNTRSRAAVHMHSAGCMAHNPRGGGAKEIVAQPWPVRANNNTVNRMCRRKINDAARRVPLNHL